MISKRFWSQENHFHFILNSMQNDIQWNLFKNNNSFDLFNVNKMFIIQCDNIFKIYLKYTIIS